jgi:hypothetical protein
MKDNKKRRKIPYNLMSAILLFILAVLSFYPVPLVTFLIIAVVAISFQISDLKSSIEDSERNIVVKINPFEKGE